MSLGQFSQVLDSRWGVPLNGSAVWLGEMPLRARALLLLHPLMPPLRSRRIRHQFAK